MTAGAERRTTPRPERESRHRAREAAVQMLYQWEVGGAPMTDVVRDYWTHRAGEQPSLGDALQAFATLLASGVAASVADIDPMIAGAAEHWRLERMNVIDRLILRMAIYEFLHEPATPAKVVINEALELARTFSTDESVRFINGILDAIRRSLPRE